jgi:hypothetical protein
MLQKAFAQHQVKCMSMRLCGTTVVRMPFSMVVLSNMVNGVPEYKLLGVCDDE